jgi:hypothetical protein
MISTVVVTRTSPLFTPAEVRRFRRLTRAGIVVALSAIGYVAVSAANPWQLVVLMPTGSGEAVALTTLTALPLLAVCAWFGLRPLQPVHARAALALLIMATTVLGLTGLYTAVRIGVADEDKYPQTAADSPAGGFELIKFDGPGDTHFRIRSRAGWRSRESQDRLACFTGSGSDAWDLSTVFGTARFTTENEVEFTTGARTTFRVRFDEHSLRSPTSPGCP